MQLKRINIKQAVMKETSPNKTINLKTLTKSTAWDVQENDIFRMLEAGEKDAEMKENFRRYTDIIRTAFMIEEIKEDNDIIRKKYNNMGYKVGAIKLSEDTQTILAI